MAIPDESALYREELLRHARHPRNTGRLELPDAAATAANPLCGDELEITLALDGGVIRDVRVQGRGCAIMQAAASMMTEVVQGLTLDEGRRRAELFRRVLDDDAGALPAHLEALAPLLTVRHHRSRIRCATLAWEALSACAGG